MRRIQYVIKRISLAAILFGLFSVPVVFADSYNLTAQVEFPAPTTPAVITGGINGKTVQSATMVVNGTCQALTPNGAVSIWRDGIAIGSAPCNGTFSITITLKNGANTLIARSASVSELYGPDSDPATVTLVLPSPVPAPDRTPANPATVDDTSQNAGVARNLTAKPSQAFSTLDKNESIILMVVVAGGETPYTIYINWGDGSEETRTVDRPGTYQFSHQYAKDGAYTVKGVVRDVLGATTTFSYAVVSQKPIQQAQKQEQPLAITAGTVSPGGSNMWWPLVYIAAGAIIAFLGYKLGVMRTAHTVTTSLAAKPFPVAAKRRRRGKDDT